MATYSTNLGLTLLATGEGAGTWGNTTNTNLGTLLEQSISGYVTESLTAGTTLTLTIPNGATGVARNMYLEFTGNGSTVIVPSNKKLYFVYNNCASGTITFKVAGQTGVTVGKGIKKVLVSDGTDIEEALTTTFLEGVTNTNLTALGSEAGDSVTSGLGNTTIGRLAGSGITSGNFNTLVGDFCGDNITTGSINTCIGRVTGRTLTTADYNTLVGHGSGVNITGASNTGCGYEAVAGGSGSTGTNNTGVGYRALQGFTSGSNNTACGFDAGKNLTTASNSTCLGKDAQITGSNQVQLGDSATTTYAYGAVQDRSDERDKADIRDTQLGLSFILALRPRDFKWDMREDYRPPAPGPDATQQEISAYIEACKLANLTHDGTHKRNRYHQGLIAQEVKQTMDAMGVDFGGYQDHTINGGDAVLTIGYEELIAPLIKAIQELKAEFDEYKRTHP